MRRRQPIPSSIAIGGEGGGAMDGPLLLRLRLLPQGIAQALSYAIKTIQTFLTQFWSSSPSSSPSSISNLNRREKRRLLAIIGIGIVTLYATVTILFRGGPPSDAQLFSQYQNSLVQMGASDNNNNVHRSGPNRTNRDINNKVPVRILSLGGSITHGALLEDPSKSAYPFLISSQDDDGEGPQSESQSESSKKSTVYNLAIRATGSEYASRCIQSMINGAGVDSMDEEEDFDVITLEYSINGLEHFDLLVRRLRDRYPRAIIIYIHLWSPRALSQDTKTNQFLNSIAGELNFGESQDWKLNKNKMKVVAHNTLDKASKLLQGPYDFVWTFPLREENEPVDMVHMYAKDFHHLNENGHAIVAGGIRKLLDQHFVITSDGWLNLRHSRLSVPTWGAWGRGDQCYSWFQSGKSPLVHENSEMKLFVAPDKYAHEISFDRKNRASVSFENRSDWILQLRVMHMVWSDDKYPKTKITSFSLKSADTSETSIILKPLHDRKGMRKSHVTYFTEVGTAMPGWNTILFEVMEKKTYPLRIVAITMCGACEDLKQQLKLAMDWKWTA